MTDNRLIAIDGDGVLLDYHEGYARAWENAFGQRPQVKDPHGYHPRHYWDVPELDEAGRTQLRTHGFTAQLWATLPALPGAVQACEALSREGYRLVCVTALEPGMHQARADNLRSLGFPIDEVIAVGPSGSAENPKRAAIARLRPVAFVDDLLPYFQDVAAATWCALIRGRPNRSPNEQILPRMPDSSHASLLEFARYWLDRS